MIYHVFIYFGLFWSLLWTIFLLNPTLINNQSYQVANILKLQYNQDSCSYLMKSASVIVWTNLVMIGLGVVQIVIA